MTKGFQTPMCLRHFQFFVATLCLILPMWVGPAQAQAAQQQGAPLEITADGSLEWDRDHKKMLAEGNALARQGTTSIAADTLTADYRDGAPDGGGLGNEIWRLTAQGNVRIETANSRAFGTHAVYDIDQGTVTLTGATPGDSAKGLRAKVLHAGDTLESDTLTAFLDAQGPEGRKSLDRVETKGRVVITTPTERVEGDRGVYVAATQIATLTGNVRITRDKNVLEGYKAEVNLATNVSRLFGSDEPSGRVRGVFYPEKDKPSE